MNNYLQEQTCSDPYGNILGIAHVCMNGCNDGACIPLPAKPLMSLSTDKTSYAVNEKVTVISQLPSSMDAVYYFVSSTERRLVGLGGSCPAAGSCFGYDKLSAGDWSAEIIAWYPNDPDAAFRVKSPQFAVSP